jgi:hypothetical protein
MSEYSDFRYAIQLHPPLYVRNQNLTLLNKDARVEFLVSHRAPPPGGGWGKAHQILAGTGQIKYPGVDENQKCGPAVRRGIYTG